MKRQLLNGTTSGEPMYIDVTPERAEGTFIYGSNKKYHDLRSGLWNVSLGYDKNTYNHIAERFSNLVSSGIPYLDSFSYNNPLYDTVTTQLKCLTDSDFSNVVFTNSGSENTELILKINSIINPHKKKKIVAFKDSYHGNFFGGMSISGIDIALNQPLPLISQEVVFLPFPKSESEEGQVLETLESIANQVSILIAEPILGSAGVTFATTHFWNKVLEITTENAILSAFDEVATGFYRTGSRFYYNQLTKKPDILSVSKAINNGITPFGALLFSKNVSDKLEGQNIEHFLTQNGNLLGFLSANEVLNIYLKKSDEIENKVNQIENILKETSMQFNIKGKIVGAMASFPISNKNNISNVIKELKNKGILVYYYLDDNKAGITLFPMFNENMDILQKTLRIVFKTLLKYQ